MSHRKRVESPDDDEVIDHSPMENLIWDDTGMMIVRLLIGMEKITGPGRSIDDILSALNDMDETNTIIGQLDRSSLEKLGQDDWPPFLDFYANACITASARSSGVLDTLIKAQIIAFQNPKIPSVPPGMEDFPRLAPALAPIRHEYPYFCNLFLGLLQSRLTRTLKGNGLLSSKHFKAITSKVESATAQPPKNSKDFKRYIDKARSFLTGKKLMMETQTAIMTYSEQVLNLNNRLLTQSLSDLCLKPIFLWLVYQDLVDDLVTGILFGEPPLRRVVTNGKTDYVPAEECPDGRFSELHDEDG
jgi:hypothetical protein